jgi:DNA-binding transcriptional MocR family regulator
MLPTVQFRSRPAIIDLSWGHPRPDLLPVDDWAEAYGTAIRRYRSAALTYGRGQGPGPMIDWLCAHLAVTDPPGPRPAEVFITAGASHALELSCSLLIRPGDPILVDAPTYHLGLRILADHGGPLIPVPTDADGIDPAATRELIGELSRSGRPPKLLYLVPTHGNPTGRSLCVARRTALIEALGDLPVIEDDTYRELSYDGPAPPSLFALSGGTVIRIGSFAKTVAPGLRLGWLTARPDLVAALTRRGYVDSGGGVNHATALAMTTFGYGRHVERIRQAYAGQRDALVSAVAAALPDASFAVPAGGWFLWLRLPPGLDTARLLPAAEAAGVSYVPGDRFYVTDADSRRLRLSFSMLDASALRAGVHRLADVTRLAETAQPAPG